MCKTNRDELAWVSAAAVFVLLYVVHLGAVMKINALSLVSPSSLHASSSREPPFPDAIVKFDYEKQQDDEISLRTGEILVNVRQVSLLDRPLPG